MSKLSRCPVCKCPDYENYTMIVDTGFLLEIREGKATKICKKCGVVRV